MSNLFTFLTSQSKGFLWFYPAVFLEKSTYCHWQSRNQICFTWTTVSENDQKLTPMMTLDQRSSPNKAFISLNICCKEASNLKWNKKFILLSIADLGIKIAETSSECSLISTTSIRKSIKFEKKSEVTFLFCFCILKVSLFLFYLVSVPFKTRRRAFAVLTLPLRTDIISSIRRESSKSVSPKPQRVK